MKAHLLYRDRDFDLTAEPPANGDDLVADLELKTLISAMARQDRFLADIAQRVLLSSLTGPDAIRYRQHVLQDFLEHADMLDEFYGVAVRALSRKRRMWGYSWTYRRPDSVMRGARECLEMYFEELRALRSVADRYISTVSSEGLTRLFKSLQEDLSDEYLDAVEGHLKRLRFPDGLLLSARLGRDNTGHDYVLRVPERDKPGWKQRVGLAPRTAYSYTIPPRDDAGAQALEDLRNRGLNQVANAAAQSADHITDYFTMLTVELGFFVGCVNLGRRLSELGATMCMPCVEPADQGVFQFRDLRDICLVLQSGQPVVGNDADADGKSIIVVTGANSGGKSTFLRSVGLAYLMAQAGMFVAASDYRASVVSGLFTHFLREEDATMTRGRLEEELDRMRTLARSVRPGGLLLFNESFHSTNEREGSEIARQIVRALTDTGIRVVFVSHQYDFAQTFVPEQGGSALFLRAELGTNGKPDYHLITAPPLATAYGPELYREIFPG